MKVIQHISHHQDSGTLRARYMDTMGDTATYTWVLENRKIRVSLGDEAPRLLPVAVHCGAVDRSRATLKPEIPPAGACRIPLRDEIELERRP